jgi:hypothetical protein
LWSLESKKVILSRDATFNENAMLKSSGSESSLSSPNTGDQEGLGEKVELETSKQSPMVHDSSSSNSQSSHEALEDDRAPIGVEPSTYSEALSGPNSSNCLVAMNEEIESLHKNGTWDLVELPRGRKALTCKWIYKQKEGIPGVEPARWKARLVVKGCNQREGIDFNEIFSP